MNSVVWLAAAYLFPLLYSIRSPLSSMSSVTALPTPGPSTVRLALVRIALELFDTDITRDMLFPIIRSMSIAIRPPERVAISLQRLHAYKVPENKNTRDHQYVETIIYREYAHAQGLMIVYIEVPKDYRGIFAELLQAVGYWGQGHSLTQCVSVSEDVPAATECLAPLRALSHMQRLHRLSVGLGAEFRSPSLKWSEIMPLTLEQWVNPLTIELYVWPMSIIEQHGGYRLLSRCPI